MIRTLAALLLMATSATAAPRVVTSVAPVQALVADIMEGVGTPDLLLDEAISSHDFALRPSQARAISEAEVIFFVGLHLEPWLMKALENSDANLVIGLGTLPNINTLPARELSEFGEAHDMHDGHDHGDVDPHVWLDPRNTLLMLDIIAGILTVSDPVNTDAYKANLETTRAEVIAASNNAKHALAALEDVELIVTHDSLQYLEVAYDLNVIGAFSASDGQLAGARSSSRLLETFGENTCVVGDISHPSRIVENLPSGVAHVTLDPMGYGVDHPTSLANLASALLHCLD